MGRAPCCDKENVKRGPWSPEEDAKLKGFIEKYGTGGNWIALPHKAGLKRCGKSCRLRWLNYLRPNIRHGEFTDDEDKIICSLYANIGSRWSIIAGQLPGRTDNDIKNYWNTKLKKKLLAMLPSFQKRHFLPLQSPPTSYYNHRSSSDHLQSLFNYDPNFYNHTTSTTNLMSLNNMMINTSTIPTTNTTTTPLVQDLSPPPPADSSNYSMMMSLITNNGFHGEHQSMYPALISSDVKEEGSNMLVFGTSTVGEGEVMSSATTASSSEAAGTSCLSQISYGNNYSSSKDQHNKLLLQKQYLYHQIKQEDNQYSFQQGTESQISFMNHKYYYSTDDEKPIKAGRYMKNYEEIRSTTTLDSDHVEEVKQLIGTTTNSSSSSSYYCLMLNDNHDEEYKTTHNDKDVCYHY